MEGICIELLNHFFQQLNSEKFFEMTAYDHYTVDILKI